MDAGKCLVGGKRSRRIALGAEINLKLDCVFVAVPSMRM